MSQPRPPQGAQDAGPEPPPLLSIGIPTYNRAGWLGASLEAWLPQAVAHRGQVEIVVCDNCSDDATPQVMRQAQQTARKMLRQAGLDESEADAACSALLRCSGNSSNLGANPNIHRVAAELARGDWVWIVGDDDMPRPDAVERVLRALKEHPHIEYIAVNYSRRHLAAPDAYALSPAEAADLSQALNPELESRLLPRLSEIGWRDENCFTPVYASVLRRADAARAFRRSLGQEPFSSVSSVVSHAVYIAENLLQRPAYYIGHPCLAVSTEGGWPKYLPAYFLLILPELYDRFEVCGAPRQAITRYRRTMLSRSGILLWRMLFDRSTPHRAQFRLLRFVRRHWHLRELWLLLLKTLARPLYALLRGRHA